MPRFPGAPVGYRLLLAALPVLIVLWGLRGGAQAETGLLDLDPAPSVATLLPGGSNDTPADLPEEPARLPVLVHSSGAPPFILRGDWVPPDLLVLVYEEEWQDALDGILDAAEAGDTETVVLVGDEELQDTGFLAWLGGRRVDLAVMDLDTPWVRDYGPLQLLDADSDVFWVDPRYAADRPYDDAVPLQLGGLLGVPITDGVFYLEGGGLISNGGGLCAMTAQTLKESSVDPRDREETDRLLHNLGCHVLAVVPALAGEDTGHVDMVAQFAGPNTLFLAEADPVANPDTAAELDAAESILRAAAREMNLSLDIIRVPMFVQGSQFFSYINGTRLAGLFLVPHYQAVPPGLERSAYDRLAQGMHGVALARIPSDRVIANGGAVHCVTLGLNLPAKTLLARHRFPGRLTPRPWTAAFGRPQRS